MTENKFKHYALILILTIVLSAVSTLGLGVFGFLFTAILASIIGYTITRYHYFFVGAVCACVVAVYALFVGNFVAAITSLLPVLLCGISLGIAYNVKLTEFKTISILSCIYTLYLLLSVKIIGVNENNRNIIEEAFKTSSEIYKETLLAAYGSEISLIEIDSLMADVMSVLMKFMPSFIIILCICVALFMFFIFKKVLKFKKSDLSLYKPFSEWQFDKSLSVVYFIIVIISFIIPEGYMADALKNVVFVSTFVFYILGLSFVDFLLKRRIKNATSEKIILILTALFSLFALGFPFILISILGAADGLLNIKEKALKK